VVLQAALLAGHLGGLVFNASGMARNVRRPGLFVGHLGGVVFNAGGSSHHAKRLALALAGRALDRGL